MTGIIENEFGMRLELTYSYRKENDDEIYFITMKDTSKKQECCMTVNRQDLDILEKMIAGARAQAYYDIRH